MSTLPISVKRGPLSENIVYVMRAHDALFTNHPTQVPRQFAAVCNVRVSDGQGASRKPVSELHFSIKTALKYLEFIISGNNLSSRRELD